MDGAKTSRWRFRGLAAALVLLGASTCAAQTPRDWAAQRSVMVERDLATLGIKHRAILAAMRDIPRHEFVAEESRRHAYLDMALPIGYRQTISPPFIVAWMTQHIDPRPTDRVLEIGTGSGYQAAVLSRLVKDVYTIEIHEPLSQRAQAVIERLGYRNVTFKVGDGYAGWPEHAPFDKIVVTCSPEQVPRPLVEQLREGGRLVIPLGESYQQTLCVMTKQAGKLVVSAREPTYFVPMVGQADAGSSTAEAPLSELVNGDFERLLEVGKPAGWYYLRQAELVDGGPTSDSQHYLTFVNRVPGNNSQALQAFGVDGRQVGEVVVELWVRGDGLAAEIQADPRGGARLVVTFFDEERLATGQQVVGPWRGSFPWRHERARLRVPATARTAIVAVGLLGATGTLSCDAIGVRGESSRSAKRR